jgi:tyrosyl-tRNA synthetase
MSLKMTFKSDFLRVLDERGFIHQISDPEGLDKRVLAGPVTAYIGFDCTAPSLHVGSMLPIMMLHWLQQTGNKPITLMGGGTTKVGDPSGKDESRKLLSEADIAPTWMASSRCFQSSSVSARARPTLSWWTMPSGWTS